MIVLSIESHLGEEVPKNYRFLVCLVSLPLKQACKVLFVVVHHNLKAKNKKKKKFKM